MGFLNLRHGSATVNLVRLPNGSFTVDPNGKVLTSTLPHTFPEQWVEQIGKHVVTAFRSAQDAQMPLRELVAEFSALKVTARSLRGGAIVFLCPQALGRK
jgi:hypothetical protein